jgi:hypothetical protein
MARFNAAYPFRFQLASLFPQAPAKLIFPSAENRHVSRSIISTAGLIRSSIVKGDSRMLFFIVIVESQRDTFRQSCHPCQSFSFPSRVSYVAFSIASARARHFHANSRDIPLRRGGFFVIRPGRGTSLHRSRGILYPSEYLPANVGNPYASRSTMQRRDKSRRAACFLSLPASASVERTFSSLSLSLSLPAPPPFLSIFPSQGRGREKPPPRYGGDAGASDAL